MNSLSSSNYSLFMNNLSCPKIIILCTLILSITKRIKLSLIISENNKSNLFNKKQTQIICTHFKMKIPLSPLDSFSNPSIQTLELSNGLVFCLGIVRSFNVISIFISITRFIVIDLNIVIRLNVVIDLNKVINLNIVITLNRVIDLNIVIRINIVIDLNIVITSKPCC